MDETDFVIPEARSESLGVKRPFDEVVELNDVELNDVELNDAIGLDVAKKKARGGGEVGVASSLKEVAEMVLVLATMAKMRGGRRPTAVEVKMMAEAREKLAEICEGFAPRNVFPMDAFGTIVEDLGLDNLKEAKSGILPQKISIAQKLQLTKQKMEKSEVLPLHSATYTPGAPLGKPDHAPVSSRNFQSHSSHASTVSNSRTLPYQLPTSEVRPVGSNAMAGSHLGRNSTASAARPYLNYDGRSNANSVTWSMQSPSASVNKTGLNNGPAHLTNINHHTQHRANFVQPPVNTHYEIAKLVQKILQPHTSNQQKWKPPSRDYMNKALTCQTCKSTVNEVDNVLVCDACEKGYHLRCLKCNPKSIFGEECREWHCAKCLAISNGKPLPLKYGRVMRNIAAPKTSTGSAGVQLSSENKVQSSNENFNQRLLSADGGDTGSQTSADIQISGTREKLSSEKCESKLQAVGNHQDADACLKQLDRNGTKLESNLKGENRKNEESVESGKIVKTSENRTTVSENDGRSPSSIHDVEWVGGVMKEIDGKKYYGSCCINGITYKLQDYALFSSTGNNLMPNKLQVMWEDDKTNKKWFTVTRCFFPDDLPEGVGRPCAPEINEVYESNHELTLAAGLIHGPCKVLSPRKYSEERVIPTRSQAKTVDKPKQLFLCKWFYDEKKRLFRDVTC